MRIIKNINDPQDTICEMCGTKFVGSGGVCSQPCADTWIKTNIDGPWNLDKLKFKDL